MRATFRCCQMCWLVFYTLWYHACPGDWHHLVMGLIKVLKLFGLTSIIADPVRQTFCASCVEMIRCDAMAMRSDWASEGLYAYEALSPGVTSLCAINWECRFYCMTTAELSVQFSPSESLSSSIKGLVFLWRISRALPFLAERCIALQSLAVVTICRLSSVGL